MERICHSGQIYVKEDFKNDDPSYDGVVLWLDVIRNIVSIIWLCNAETKIRETIVLLNITCILIALLGPAAGLYPITLEVE